MKNKEVNEKLKYIISLLVFILIFSFALACGVEPPIEEVSGPTEEEGVKEVDEELEEETVEVAKDIEEKSEMEYRETELGRKLPKVEWKIGEPIDFPNGLRLTLNKVWKEKQYGENFIVINVTLENTTNETQDDGIVFSMPGSIFYVYDSEDNKFLSDGCLEGNTIFDEIYNLSPGINKKWKPGVKLTGNICCNVPEESKCLNIELEYFKFLRTNVIYCYKLEDIEE